MTWRRLQKKLLLNLKGFHSLERSRDYFRSQKNWTVLGLILLLKILKNRRLFLLTIHLMISIMLVMSHHYLLVLLRWMHFIIRVLLNIMPITYTDIWKHIQLIELYIRFAQKSDHLFFLVLHFLVVED